MTTVRPGELRCQACHEWLPDEAYGLGGRAVRRGRRDQCKPCRRAAERVGAPPEALPTLELDPADECAEAARRLLERHDLALDALRTQGGGPDDGYALLARVAWPPEDDPDYELIEAARPLWAARAAAAPAEPA